MTAICGMISWGCILWTYLRWHKGMQVQGIDRSILPYRAPFQPYLSYYGIFICVMVLIFGGFTAFSKPICLFLSGRGPENANADAVPTFDSSSFVTTYFPIPFFLVLYIGYKFVNKSELIAYEKMDFITGSSLDIACEVSLPMRRLCTTLIFCSLFAFETID
jgi:amino acid transporter